MDGDGTAVDLPPVSLAAGEIRELVLQPLLQAAASRSDLSSVSVRIENTGAPGSLIGALYTTNQTTGVFYDVPLRDSGIIRNSTGAYPIRLDDDYKTTVTITNVGGETAQIAPLIRWPGGKYVFLPQTLNVGQSAAFDIRKLRDNQTLDQNGAVLPADLTYGQFAWSLIRSKTARLIGRSEVVSRSRGVSSSYSCPHCPWSGPYRAIPNISVASGDTTSLTVYEEWLDLYDDSTTYLTYISGLATYDSSIATAAMAGTGTMNATGVGVGETDWYGAEYYLYVWGRGEHYECEDFGYNTSDSGPIEVTPPSVTNVTSDTGTYKITNTVGNTTANYIHFVTPKGTGDVTLTATISPDTTANRNNITWEGATQSSTNKLVATLSRGTASKNIVKIKYQGNVIKELRVWVVWATITSADIPITQPTPRTTGTPSATAVAIQGGYTFTHTIEPSQMITDTNRPDFCGSTNPSTCVANITAPPGNNHPIFGTALSGGADKKWNSSRQIRYKILNPNNVAVNDTIYYPLGSFPADSTSFPSNDAEGNDDTTTLDEINLPYTQSYLGLLVSQDEPTCALAQRNGNDGDTFEVRYQFREFTRLEIEGTWYRISDPYLWRIHFKFKKVNGAWANDSTTKALDNAGF